MISPDCEKYHPALNSLAFDEITFNYGCGAPRKGRNDPFSVKKLTRGVSKFIKRTIEKLNNEQDMENLRYYKLKNEANVASLGSPQKRLGKKRLHDELDQRILGHVKVDLTETERGASKIMKQLHVRAWPSESSLQGLMKRPRSAALEIEQETKYYQENWFHDQMKLSKYKSILPREHTSKIAFVKLPHARNEKCMIKKSFHEIIARRKSRQYGKKDDSIDDLFHRQQDDEFCRHEISFHDFLASLAYEEVEEDYIDLEDPQAANSHVPAHQEYGNCSNSLVLSSFSKTLDSLHHEQHLISTLNESSITLLPLFHNYSLLQEFNSDSYTNDFPTIELAPSIDFATLDICINHDIAEISTRHEYFVEPMTFSFPFVSSPEIDPDSMMHTKLANLSVVELLWNNSMHVDKLPMLANSSEVQAYILFGSQKHNLEIIIFSFGAVSGMMLAFFVVFFLWKSYNETSDCSMQSNVAVDAMKLTKIPSSINCSASLETPYLMDDGDHSFSSSNETSSTCKQQFELGSITSTENKVFIQKDRMVIMAPKGALGLVLRSTEQGPAIFSIKPNSSVAGTLRRGDVIVQFDGADTTKWKASTLMLLIAKTSLHGSRKFVVLR